MAERKARHESVQGGEGAKAAQGDPQVDSTAAEARSKLVTAEPAGSGDAGPGTRQEEPPQDELQRGQARMHVGAGHVAAPIEAPDAATQTDPAEGHARSSNNPVAANAVIGTHVGENHVRLVDENGKGLDAGTVFEGADPTKTYRVTAQRVYEEFNYQGSTQPMTRLLYPAGHRVSLTEAARLQHATELGQAQLAQEKGNIAAEGKAFHGAS